MKNNTSFLKRCLALALALVLVVSNVNLGVALKANAAGITVSEAEIVANNYDELSAAEKALLSSGYLPSGDVTYTVPTDNDGLVAVDTENAKITAASKDGWVATKAVIVYGSNELAVELVDGVATYDPAVVGNAFSVKVTYSLDVDVANQEALFDAMAALKQGVANTDAVSSVSGNLYILEQALPELATLVTNGITTSFGSSINFTDELKGAVYALNDQVKANGKLNLSAMIEEYEAGSKTAYLMDKGTAMQAEVEATNENLKTLNVTLETMVENLTIFVEQGWVNQTTANQLKTVANVAAEIEAVLTPVSEDPWTAANTPDLLAKPADAELDALVEALGALANVTVKNPLNVATAELSANLAMWNVNVTYTLDAVNPETNLVEEVNSQSVKLTLAENATAEEILAAVEESGIEAYALETWSDVYVEGKFSKTATTLPNALVADIDYVVTYSPNVYEVDIAGEVNSYPYGTKVTLPVHEDPTQAYDYKADGVYYAQGTEIVVTDNITFTREQGKAYSSGNLLAIIADNYGTEKITAILTSGAVMGDEVINYREPTKAELETLVQLSGSTLTVQSYASSYAGLNWEPYSYVVDGNTYYFNGNSEVTISGDFETVDVYYRLTLSNYTEAEVKDILDLTATLVDEAEGQKTVMDKLAENEGQMSQLTKNMLNGLNGVIGGYSTENGGGLNDDPAKNDELVAYFQATIGDIVKKCTDTNGYLKLYNIILAYNDPNNGGLTYYYQNHETVRNEIAVLSGYLADMLDGGDRQAALEKLMAENGHGDKVDVLDSLNGKLATISAELKPVNAAIDTSDPAKLSALAKALTMEGSVAYTECGSPYLEMGPVIRTAEKYVTVEVKAIAAGKNIVVSKTILKGNALTQAQVNEMKADIDEFIAATIDADLYSNNYNNGAELDALVGVALTEGASYTYEWTAKTYIVKIEGEADQTISVDNLTVNLPAHPQAASGMSYEYTVPTGTANAGIYTFTTEQVKTLFVNDEYTITRVEKNAAVEKLVAMVNNINSSMGFEAMTLVEENGLYTGIVVNVAASDLMDLVMGLVQSGYGYIGLNNEGLMYENDKAELEISIQTLINAILADEDFNNDTIIALGENGKGKLLTASMQLGNSAADLEYSNLTFVMNLTSVPAQLTNNVDTLKTVSNYLYFQSNNGKLDVEVTLPDQAFGAYAAALIATGNVDKSDVNELEQAVALQFLYDYLTAITGSEMDMQSFTNTLKMLGIDKDLTGYNNYYEKGINAYNEWITVAISNDGASIDISAPGNTVIDGLIKFSGMDASKLDTYLTMIKEYKVGGTIEASAVATLSNTDKTYYALIVDAQANGATNKFEAPSSYDALYKEVSSLAGYSAVILLDNVPGNLHLSGTTVLDLNGKAVEGTISGDNLYIIDSSMDTYNAGSAYGVSGNAVVFGGNYYSDVKAYLKDGYYMDGTTVRNALYYITDVDGTVTFVLNGDVYESEYVDGYIPNAKALAVDIASDLVLNYATSASLTIEGNTVVAIDVDDLVGLYAGDTVNGLVKALMGCVFVGEEGYENNEGFEAVVNLILEDILDFSAISTALSENTALATYGVSLNPWQIEIDHVTDGDYATVNVTNNADLAKNVNVALVVESKYNESLAALAGELANIVVADETEALVDIPQPTYSDKQLTVAVSGKATAVVDMSANSDYATMIGVILAYGNSGKRAAVAEAINNNDMTALKAVVDGTSVKEVFTALKKLSRSTDFAAMAAAVGVTVDVASAGELEAIYHVYLCGVGAALEKLDITGMDSKLGALYNEETGYYELTKTDIFRDKEFSARGYSALVELTADELTLKVKLFGEVDCLWGDADHDGDVDQHDASLVFEYFMNDGDIDQEICLIRTDVNQDGKIDNHDASIIFEYFMEDKTEELPEESAN